MAYRLGVDLGTTFTAAATVDLRSGQPPAMLGLGNRALQIPSVLFLQEDGQFLIGEAAERRGYVEPSRVVREFKRRIGDPVPILVAGTPFSPQALTARLLSWVVATATERQGTAPDEVVVTYPANWGDYKRELLDQVITMADIGPARTCTEPQAAAIQYAARAELQPGARVAVYDLGGGTFDVCILERTPEGFAILGSPEGVEHLGGVDFDEAVFQHVVTALGPSLQDLDLNDAAVKAALTRLRRDCVEAKEALSADVDTVIPVSLPGRSTTVRLTRAELENLIGPALQDTIAATTRALRAAGLTAQDLSAIVLVGGSSRIPLVSHLLQSEFGTTTALDTHPKHDIALGAVQFGTPGTAAVAAPVRRQPGAAVAAGAGLAAGGSAKEAREARARQDAATIRDLLGPGTAEASEATEPIPVTPSGDPLAGQSGGPAAGPSGTPVSSGREPFGGGGGQPPPDQSGGEHDDERRRKMLLAISGASAAVVVVVIAIVAALAMRNDGGTPPTAGRSSPSQSAPTTTTPASDLLALPQAPAPLPDTQLLIPMDAGNGSGLDIYTADARSGARKLLGARPGIQTTPALSPDRRTMVYSVADDPGGHNGLWVAGVDMSGARPLFKTTPPECAEASSRPGWSPTSAGTLAMACKKTATAPWMLYLISTDGKVLRTLDTANQIGDPGFSPDGRTVVYWANKSGQGIFLATVDGSKPPSQVSAGLDADPAFAPTGGGLLAFRRLFTVRSSVVVVMNVNGTAIPCAGKPIPARPNVPNVTVCQLTDPSVASQDPSWSPDATEIAYKTGPVITGDSEIKIIRADGGAKPRRAWTPNPGPQQAPAWTPR